MNTSWPLDWPPLYGGWAGNSGELEWSLSPNILVQPVVVVVLLLPDGAVPQSCTLEQIGAEDAVSNGIIIIRVQNRYSHRV